MERVFHDLRFAARSLAKSPGWTATAVLTLALGVAANTTVYTWLRSTVLEPIPGAADSDRLRVVLGRAPSGEWVRLSHPDYRDLSREKSFFDGVLAQQWINVALGRAGGQPPRSLSGALVSDNYFDVLGVRTALGRGFRPEETAGAGAAPAAVISHSLWEQAFDRDPSIVGKPILLNARPYTIVGVAPAGFYGSFLGIGVDVFVPLVQEARFEASGDRLEKRSERWLLSIARVKHGVSDAGARAAVRGFAARLNRDFPGVHDGYGLDLFTLAHSPWGGPAELGPILLTLAGLVSLVLLIACANLANLLLNRALGRRREVAIRLALGASRWDVVRQILCEGLVLAVLAAAAAAIATGWTSGLLTSFIPPTGFPVRMDAGVDGRTVAFALGVSLAGTFLFGLLPALASSRWTVTADLANETARTTGGPSRAMTRRVLVGAQMALSLALLVAAALFLRSLSASQRLDPGFRTSHLLLVQVKLFPSGYGPERGIALLERLESGGRALPGVTAAALARRVPLGFGGFASRILSVDGYPARPGEEIRARCNEVSAGYLATMGFGLKAGREFQRSDRAGSEPVAVVNEAFAKRYFAGRSALGGRLRIDGVWRRIVGVAADAKYEKLSEPPLPFLFLPLLQNYQSDVVLHLRTVDRPASALPAVRSLVRGLDPNLPLFEVQTMDEHLAEELISQRIGSRLLGSLGVLALLLSGVGLYALGAFSVAERRREIGVRMALGATPRQLAATFVIGGLRLAGAGMAAGLATALAIGRLLASQLVGIRPADPLAFSAVSAVVLAISIGATYIPVRRATRVDPAAALRTE